MRRPRHDRVTPPAVPDRQDATLFHLSCASALRRAASGDDGDGNRQPQPVLDVLMCTDQSDAGEREQ